MGYFLLLIFYYLLSIQRAFAQSDDTIPLPELKNLTKWADLNEFVRSIPNLLVGLASVIFLFVLVYGGYVYLTARGNEEKEHLAKNIFLFAIMGLIIVLGAYAVVIFLLSKLGVQFQIVK